MTFKEVRQGNTVFVFDRNTVTNVAALIVATFI